MPGSLPNKAQVRKRKVMGSAEVVSREEFEALDRENRIKLVKQLIPIGLMVAAEELQREVDELLGPSHTRRDNLVRRYGSNPGSVCLGGQRIPIKVPRVRTAEGEVHLKSYDLLHHPDTSGTLFQSILQGVSCRNYEQTTSSHWGSVGRSKSSASRQFVEVSSKQLKAFLERDLSDKDIIGIFIDGTSFGDDQMILALGVTIDGEKVLLGFTQSSSENTSSVSLFLRSLLDRGLRVDQGVLAVCDGSKGLISALKKVFGKSVLIQRCQWHKRENIAGYMAKTEQPDMRKRLQKAYDRPNYDEAIEALTPILCDLEERNQSAWKSLHEGFEETLTLHRLKMFAKIGISFKTTNCIESVNSMVKKTCGKVSYWKNSSQKQRWLASALIEIEPKMRRAKGHRHLSELRKALIEDLGLVVRKNK